MNLNARTSTNRTNMFARLILLPALLLLVWTLAPSDVYGQMKNDHVSWKLLTPKVTGKPGDKVDVKIKVDIVPKAHLYTTTTYPDTVLAAPEPTEVTAGEKGIITRAGKVRSNKPHKTKFDKQFDINTEYWEGSVTLTVPLRISKSAKIGEGKGWVEFYFMTCTDEMCRPPTEERLEFTVVVEEDTTQVEEPLVDADTVDEALTAVDTNDVAGGEGDTNTTEAATTAVAGNDDGPSTIQEQIAEKKKEGLLSYILFAMGFGFLALSTPCVFPMIPITISFFTKREQKSKFHAARDAGIYALGIIFTFTALGAIVSGIYGATGVSEIATNPYINMFIAGIFIVFALSLFGLFEIQVPSSVLNRLNAKANQGAGVTSILLMGFVFSLTSFTCTVPFVGPSLMDIQGGEWFWPMIGMASFATAFAVPFFLLAIFPSLLKAMPKSGGWLNAVKVTMGFVEVAAAMKFLSNVDLIWDWGLLTREVVLSVWISIAVLTSLYLLGRFRLPHDTPTEKIGVARMLFSMSFLAIGFWFLTGLFGGQLGEIDAFLPPQEYPGKGNTSILASISRSEPPSTVTEAGGVNYVEADGLMWVQDDYQAALKESKRTGKPIFVDFTGYTCTNCRWMERNVFTLEEVRDLMNQYVLARLYTDRREESNKINRQLQIDRFNTIDLPFYALFSPSDEVIAQIEFTRDDEAFKNFLKRGLKSTKVVEKKADAETDPKELASAQ